MVRLHNTTHYYYVEFQPWIPILQQSTLYFTYYLWGARGPLEDGVESLRTRNLISVQDPLPVVRF